MKITYVVQRDLIGENEYGDMQDVLRRDTLYVAETEELAWAKYKELRSSYIFRWTKRSISTLRFKRIES